MDYDALLAKQGGVCAICKRAGFPVRGPYIDHDHRSGKVRGILCHFCNLMLGYMEDDPAIAQAMTVYLLQHNAARHAAKETT